MRYIPATPEEVARMLSAIGVDDIRDLFHTVPDALKLGRPLDVPAGLSELDLVRQCEALGDLNSGARMSSFLGGGAYSHFIPAVVDMVISRSEFATAYTPYQAEVAQGTLQAVFQMQTYVCELMGMEVANASNYEGASSLAEAALMTQRMRKKRKGPERILVSRAVNPEHRETLRTYLKNTDITLVETPWDEATGETDWAAMAQAAAEGALGIIVQSPNHFGVIERLAEQRALCDRVEAAMVVSVVEPISLGLLAPPGHFGADIAVGEGQGMGIPVSFGGPYVGLFATRMEYVRAMPGRLVGQTTDVDGQRGYVLTLSTREQHIRREKATSNICTNAGLMALAFTVYTSLVGKRGLPELAQLNYNKARYLKERLRTVPHLRLPFSAPTFNEVVVEHRTKTAAEVLLGLEAKGILGGLSLAELQSEARADGMDRRFLVAVTEMNSRAAIDGLVDALREDT